MSRRSVWYLSVSFVSFFAIAVVACSDSPSAVPTVTGIELAAGGVIKDPTVKSTVPDSAFQGDSLEVIVLGSNFDDGSTVQMELNGDTTGVEMVETVFVTSRELRAKIKVIVEADTGLYDVAVRTSRDKKGIGTEMFRVRERVNNNQQIEWPTAISMVVDVLEPDGITTHGLTDVSAVDGTVAMDKPDALYLCRPGAADEFCTQGEKTSFFGCPDPTRTCNAIRLTFMGEADVIQFKVQPSVQGCLENGEEVEGGCVYDLDLVNRRNAATWYQTAHPGVPLAGLAGTDALVDHGDGTKTLRIFWQGQRGQWSIDAGLYEQYIWSRYPDMDYPGGHDHYVFLTSVGVGSEGQFMQGVKYQDCTVEAPCWAEYEGALRGQQAYVVWDEFKLGGGGGRYKDKNPSYITFALQTFGDDPSLLPQAGDGGLDYLNPVVVDANLRSWLTTMVTDPNGARSIGSMGSVGVNPDDPEKPEIHKSVFGVSFGASGCYEVRLLDSFMHDENALGYVWYSANDPSAVYLRIDYQEGGTISWTPGGRCN